MLSRRIIPCLDVTAGRVVKGVQVPGAARRRRSRRVRRAPTTPRARTSWSSSTSPPRATAARSCATSSPPPPSSASCRSPSAAACAPSPTSRPCSRPGADKVSLNTAAIRQPGADPRRLRPLRRPVHRPGDRRQARARRRSRAGASTPTAAAIRPARRGRLGRDAAWHSARARSSSPAWTATAPRPATTSSSPGGSATPSRSRDRQRRGGPPGGFRRGARPGPRQRRAGRLPLPFRHPHGAPGQGLPRRPRGAGAQASTARLGRPAVSAEGRGGAGRLGLAHQHAKLLLHRRRRTPASARPPGTSKDCLVRRVLEDAPLAPSAVRPRGRRSFLRSSRSARNCTSRLFFGRRLGRPGPPG